MYIYVCVFELYTRWLNNYIVMIIIKFKFEINGQPFYNSLFQKKEEEAL
jgi:hypothetical protein